MMKKKPDSGRSAGKSAFARAAENSLIISYLSALSVRLHDLVSGSFLAAPLCASESIEKAKSTGFFSRLIMSSPLPQLFLRLKAGFARAVEGSRAVALYRRLVTAVLSASIRSLGVFLMSFGLYSLAAYAVRIYSFSFREDGQGSIICMTLCIICSIPMLFSSKSIAEKLSESAAFSSLLFGLLGINPLTLKNKYRAQSHGAAALVLGTVYGVLSFFYTPLSVFTVTLTVIFALVVMYSPESGLLTTLLLVPFADYGTVSNIMILTAAAYLLKLLRGKRNLTFTAADSMMLLFTAAYAISAGSDKLSSILMAYFVYLLTVNQLRSVELLEKSLRVIGAGLFISSAFCAAVSAASLAGVELSRYIGASVVNLSDSGFIALIAIPSALLSRRLANSRTAKLMSFIFLASALFNAVMSFSLPVWYGAAAVTVLYALLRSAKLFNTVAGAAVLIPLAALPLFRLTVYNDVPPFAVSPLFTYSEPLVRLFGGGTPAAGDGFYTAVVSLGGIVLLLLFALAVYFVLSVGFTSINARRLTNVRAVCGGLICISVAFLYIWAFPGTWSDSRMLMLFMAYAGMLSCSGGVFARHYAGDNY